MGILLFVKESEDHSWDRTKERSNSFFCRDQKLNVLLLWFMIYLWWSHRKISFAVSFQITEYILFSIQIIRIIIFTDFVLCFSAKYRLSHQIGIRDPDPRYISSVAVSLSNVAVLQTYTSVLRERRPLSTRRRTPPRLQIFYWTTSDQLLSILLGQSYREQFHLQHQLWDLSAPKWWSWGDMSASSSQSQINQKNMLTTLLMTRQSWDIRRREHL